MYPIFSKIIMSLYHTCSRIHASYHTTNTKILFHIYYTNKATLLSLTQTYQKNKNQRNNNVNKPRPGCSSVVDTPDSSEDEIGPGDPVFDGPSIFKITTAQSKNFNPLSPCLTKLSAQSVLSQAQIINSTKKNNSPHPFKRPK